MLQAIASRVPLVRRVRAEVHRRIAAVLCTLGALFQSYRPELQCRRYSVQSDCTFWADSLYWPSDLKVNILYSLFVRQ